MAFTSPPASAGCGSHHMSITTRPTPIVSSRRWPGSWGNSALLPQAFIDHEAAGDLQLADGAGQQLLLAVQIAVGGETEIAEAVAVAFERREHAGQADGRMGAGREG